MRCANTSGLEQNPPLFSVPIPQMAREVAAGMQYLHEHNIVHGDLNPANVLLKRDDASVLGYAAKIADFGLSVHMHAEQVRGQT